MSPDAPSTAVDRHMQADLDKIIIDRGRIAARVAELAAEIRHDLASLDDDAEIVLVTILTGSIIFVADLIRELPQTLSIEVLSVQSYPDTATQSQGPRLIGAADVNIDDRHVIIVDDILDSGGTLKLIRDEFGRRNTRSVKACVLLRKQRPSAMDTPCEYVGFDIPDVFVVGYGLDYNNYYRNLPDIRTLKAEAM
jgi:hypoxanthine phosphoribosyltransferase